MWSGACPSLAVADIDALAVRDVPQERDETPMEAGHGVLKSLVSHWQTPDDRSLEVRALA